MLVLTRRFGESITISQNIEITVVRADGNQVKLLVKAPKEIPVIRSELAARRDRKRQGN